jgi:alcohol oxidase
MYTRASASDYDDWETMYKNPGWASKDLIPLLKQVSPYPSDGPDLLATIPMMSG